MNQETNPNPASRPSLEEVRYRFENWRMSKQVRSKIPDTLWESAAELCKEHSIVKVCRALRLNYNDLKNRVRGVEKIAVSSSGGCSEFVELDFRGPNQPSECVVEMESPNGSKMKMYFKGQQKGFDVVALSRAFWGQGL